MIKPAPFFKKELYQAIVEGRKTQTRRPLRYQSLNLDEYSEDGGPCQRVAPYQVGDKLYVREPFKIMGFNISQKPYRLVSGRYTRDRLKFQTVLTEKEHAKWVKWKTPFKGKSSLFMFKSLARLWIEITGVRVERLQDISEADAKAEGAKGHTKTQYHYRQGFGYLWDSIYGKTSHAWKNNTWNWVFEFKVLNESEVK